MSKTFVPSVMKMLSLGTYSIAFASIAVAMRLIRRRTSDAVEQKPNMKPASKTSLVGEFAPGTEITVRGVRIRIVQKSGRCSKLSICAEGDPIYVKTPDGTITRFDKPAPVGTVIVVGKI